jgi:hypothetical protein
VDEDSLMTLSELRQLVARWLDEDGIRREASVLDDSLNEGYLMTCLATQAYEVTKTMLLLPQSPFYQLPSDFFLPVAAYLEGTRLYPVRMDELNLLYGDWFLTSVTGTPTYYFTVGALTTHPQLWLYPQLAQQATLTLTYAGVPQRLAADTSVPRIPEEYHVALAYWAFAWELLKERGNEVIGKTTRIFKQFVELTQKLREFIYHRTPDRDAQTMPWDLTVFERKLRKLQPTSEGGQ